MNEGKAAHVRQFSKTQPCTKIDIWNCFRDGTKFAPVLLVLAYEQIGRNVPHRLLKDGRAMKFERANAEWLELTEKGEKWAYDTTLKYLRNNPAKIAEVKNKPRIWTRVLEKDSHGRRKNTSAANR